MVVQQHVLAGPVAAQTVCDFLLGAAEIQAFQLVDGQGLQAPSHKADFRDPPQEHRDGLKVGEEAREQTAVRWGWCGVVELTGRKTNVK